jgi:hypothetical protein
VSEIGGDTAEVVECVELCFYTPVYLNGVGTFPRYFGITESTS